MHQAHGDIGEDLAREVLVHFLRGLHGLGLGFLDHRVDHVGLAALVDLPLQEAVNLLDAVGGGVLGDDGLAAGRQLVDDGDVQVAIKRHGQRARNGRGGHHQDVGMHGLLHQSEALQDAEAVLLVDDGEAEILELHVLFEQRVRADRHVRQAFGDQFLELDLLAAGERSGQQQRDIAQLS